MCINYNCDKHTWGNHLRCSDCRRNQIYKCTDCPNEINTNRGVRCALCWAVHNAKHIKKNSKKHNQIRSEMRRKDLVCYTCNKKLPFGRSRYCSDRCRGKEMNKRYSKRKVKECVMCFKSLVGLDRKMTCSLECYNIYRNIYYREKARWLVKNRE